MKVVNLNNILSNGTVLSLGVVGVLTSVRCCYLVHGRQTSTANIMPQYFKGTTTLHSGLCPQSAMFPVRNSNFEMAEKAQGLAVPSGYNHNYKQSKDPLIRAHHTCKGIDHRKLIQFARLLVTCDVITGN